MKTETARKTARADIPDRKAEVIRVILSNSTYMPDSGLYVQLKTRLLKWSQGDLENLRLVLSIQRDDAVAAD